MLYNRRYMNINEVLERISNACKAISNNESSVWSTNEWNICAHLRDRLNHEFTNFDVDVEPVKHNRMRPDIVIHKRGDNSVNLVVLQAKKRPSEYDLKDDLSKINNTFFKEPYRYEYGVLLCIGKLPHKLPDFDINRIGIVEVNGWELDESISTNIPARKINQSEIPQ